LQLKAARCAGRRTLSAQSSGRSWPRPEDARRRTLYNDLSQSSPKGRPREHWRTGGLASMGVSHCSQRFASFFHALFPLFGQIFVLRHRIRLAESRLHSTNLLPGFLPNRRELQKSTVAGKPKPESRCIKAPNRYQRTAIGSLEECLRAGRIAFRLRGGVGAPWSCGCQPVNSLE
jgi:hypothetical protein